MISIVEPQSLDYVWASLRPKILKALSVGAGINQTEQHYYDSVKSGLMQMWIYHIDEKVVGGGILSVQQMPRGKKIFIEMLAGERLDEWLEEIERLVKEYATEIGATTIEASCRPGLVKKLTRWQPVATLMRLK